MGPHDDRKPLPQRSWMRKAIAPIIIAGLFVLGVFVVIPHFSHVRYRDELAAVNALAEKGPIEAAINKYEALAAEAKGSEVAEAAERASGPGSRPSPRPRRSNAGRTMRSGRRITKGRSSCTAKTRRSSRSATAPPKRSWRSHCA